MKTKEKIVFSLIELMHEKKFETITIKEISQKAGIYRSTYYRNFQSKEDIIKYKLSTIMNEYLEKYLKEEEKTKKQYFKILFSTFQKYETFLITIHKQKQSYILQQVLQEYFNTINIDNTTEKYEIYYHIGGIYNFIICWIENKMDETPEQLTEISLKITKNKKPLLLNNHIYSLD